ncbi:hypothetical protein KYK29_10180 [Shinella daejeonensis]|uniref:hypothetical protein n=1 Tax=Shinella daejeonensis TaxID=659017 RepID=UPI0020C757E8|nr:hypothetical protein [Shinella daejeonensis]MCP8895302.1 hypothetical protein [Shinella daejeonensis]
MVDMPERIHASLRGPTVRNPSNGRRMMVGGWSENPARPGATEYVRADLYADLYAELEAENERLTSDRDGWMKAAIEQQSKAKRCAEALSRTGAVKVKRGVDPETWGHSPATQEGDLPYVCDACVNGNGGTCRCDPSPEGRQEAVARLTKFAVNAARGIDILGEVLGVWGFPEGHPQWQRIVVRKVSEDIISALSAQPIEFGEGCQDVSAWRVTYANGETVFLSDKPAGDSGVYECLPLYARPSEQAVTEAMVDILRLAYSCGYVDSPGDRDWSDNEARLLDALKAAMEAGG